MSREWTTTMRETQYRAVQAAMCNGISRHYRRLNVEPIHVHVEEDEQRIYVRVAFRLYGKTVVEEISGFTKDWVSEGVATYAMMWEVSQLPKRLPEVMKL